MNSMEKYHSRNCVCCNSTTLESLYKIEDIGIIMKSGSVTQTLNVQICKDCGMVFLNPIPEIDFYHRYYGDALRVVADEEGKGRREKRAQQFGYCKKSIIDYDQGGMVLDIGAHDGSLLSYFKDDGWQVYGCDLSPAGKTFANTIYGIQIDQRDFLATNYEENSFDVITIFQVLEHIIEPLPLLLQVKSYLKDDGLFIIEIPNLDKPSEKNLANYFDFEHVSYFEQGSIKNILIRAGFKIVSMELFQLNKSLRLIAKKGTTQPNIYENRYRVNRARVLNYKTQYDKIIDQVESRLEDCGGKKIVLFGAGQHSEQLLREVKRTSELEIVSLVDSNPAKWGKTIFGLKVMPPEWLKDKDEYAVVISSFSFFRAIEETIRSYNRQVEIIRLYE